MVPVPSFEDIAVKAQQKTYILRDSARDAQSELHKQVADAQKQLDKALPVQLKDLTRYVQRVEMLYQLLDKGEVKTLLMFLSGTKKSRIFSTNFAIGFFRGAGAMLGVAVIAAAMLLIIFNSPYQEDLVRFLSSQF